MSPIELAEVVNLQPGADLFRVMSLKLFPVLNMSLSSKALVSSSLII